MTEYVAGIDVGSTSVKLLIATLSGRQRLLVSRPTPWRGMPDGGAEMDGARLGDLVRELAHAAEDDLRTEGPHSIVALGVSGMAEAGVVLDAADQPQAPVMAWFDPRGGVEMAATPDAFRAEFPGRTGLPVGPLATFSKLLYLRERGLDLRTVTFLNVPEYVVHVLGGERVAEYSLVSRTGLIDQDDSSAWAAALDVLGVDESIIARRVGAGSPVATLTDPLMPTAFHGAVLTVAGHDHLVSAVAVGATSSGQIYDSMGTAEALVRVLDGALPFDARARLAAAGINTVRHVLPGKFVLLAGTKSGLLMRRALQVLGVNDAAGRARIDAEIMALPTDGGLDAGALTVTGARNDDGVLKIVANSDGLSPAALFRAVLEHGNDMLDELMQVMNDEVAPPTETVLTGGWSSMAAAVHSRRRVLPEVTVSTHDEATAYGASLFAAFALSGAEDADFDSFAASYIAAGGHTIRTFDERWQ